MSSEYAVRLQGVGKTYAIYDQPIDQPKQSILPRLERLAGRPPSKFYRDFAALSDISFEIKVGETVGVNAGAQPRHRRDQGSGGGPAGRSGFNLNSRARKCLHKRYDLGHGSVRKHLHGTS